MLGFGVAQDKYDILGRRPGLGKLTIYGLDIRTSVKDHGDSHKSRKPQRAEYFHCDPPAIPFLRLCLPGQVELPADSESISEPPE